MTKQRDKLVSLNTVCAKMAHLEAAKLIGARIFAYKLDKTTNGVVKDL